MIRSILIGGIFAIVLFLLLPDNKTLNNLGIELISLYFFGGIIYIPIMVLWMWIFNIKRTPFESIDNLIYEKYFKKWLSK
ncbi:hypothetical protein [Helicobacter sp. 13S00477-4]|uniref:hypothetical protein n=1 Tax=Helicobacter sp. 13S00477-4 TaxID=1905759 RepID=UPI000BA5A658|nr:hypothetical protein [Helicobacter sp. 13S00477-4]PAF51968.1 hypothetical protein BKH44_04730 [Helicobacter sp. 13S00477-4]